MSIMSRMARPKAVSQEIERLIRTTLGGGSSTTSGATVSSESAMRQATVYSCVHILSRVIGMLPCHIMERKGKNREPARGFHLYEICHDLPNDWMTSSEFWGMVIGHLVLRGNFFALKQVSAGKLRGLIPFAPGIVTSVEQKENYSLWYHLSLPNGEHRVVPRKDIMHIKGMTLNGYMGMNPIEYIRESIGLGLATEEFGARYFGSGTHPSMIVEHPGKLSENAHTNLKDSLGTAYSGLGKAHRMMLLEEGMKASPITISPEDSQFLDTRRYQKSEIVDIFFGMPLTAMGTSDSTPTFASAEQFSIGFVIYALMPWIVNIEKAIYRDLLTPADRVKYYAKFKAEGLLRGSFKEQMESFATAIDKEIFNPNEVREMLDYNGYGPQGDEYRTRTSSVKEAPGEKAPGEDK